MDKRTNIQCYLSKAKFDIEKLMQVNAYVWQNRAMEKIGMHCNMPPGLQRYTLSIQSPASRCGIASAIT
jgi:hypothetical protein